MLRETSNQVTKQLIAMKINQLILFCAFLLSIITANAGEGWMTDFDAALVKAKQEQKTPAGRLYRFGLVRLVY